MDYCTVFKIQYHFIFVTKYRYQELKGDIVLRDLIHQTCEALLSNGSLTHILTFSPLY